MSKNRISITISAEQAQSARAGVAQTRAALPGLITLEADERGLLFMGPQSQAFVRGCLRVLRENPQLVPPGLNLAEAEADLAAYDALRPIADQVLQLSNQLQDNLTALGSDAMDVALDGYAQIKLWATATAWATCARRSARAGAGGAMATVRASRSPSRWPPAADRRGNPCAAPSARRRKTQQAASGRPVALFCF